MLFKSQILTQASGSIGGITASRNRGGMYFRARAIPTDPNTAPQANIRSIFGSLVNRWINTLTLGQRNNWNSYAANVPLTGPLGDPVIVSGLNHYVRSNTPRVQIITPIIDDAPFIFDTGTLSPVSIDTLSAGVQQFNVNFTEADGWNVANGHIVLQQSRPQNPSINFFRGPYQNVGSVNGVDVTPATKPVIFPVAEGQRVFFRVRATYADGRLTQAQFVGPVLVAA